MNTLDPDHPTTTTRREFVKMTAAAAVASAAATTTSNPSSARAAGSNQRLRIGIIGPGGRGFGVLVKSLVKMRNEGANIELAALAEVYSIQRDMVADYIQRENGRRPTTYVDYREMFAKENLDGVVIATPDHWHATQTIDAFGAGLNVYCEKPMTKSVEETLDVVAAWKKSGKVMQVGVQSTSEPVWDLAREKLEEGLIGKVLMYQTEYSRNSIWGQWRNYQLTEEMSPKTINWDLWLGKEQGLAPDMPFDREIYKQWRRFWPFGSGMYTDLFVHRVTTMLKATGLRFPGRVVGAGGIYLEYDGRDVPDMATIAADYPEGVHGLVTSTMCNAETRIRRIIRGYFGSLVFGGNGFEFVPEDVKITGDNELKSKRFRSERPADVNVAHLANWVEAMQTADPAMCHNPPDLGAAAVTMVILGARSYREGRAFQFDLENGVQNADANWAARWEQMSRQRSGPNHIPGWKAGDYGSKMQDPEWMKLAGPWIDGRPPGA